MNFLLILIALVISGIAVLAIVALGGERAVPGAAFFSGVGRDGLGTFDRVEDLGFIARLFGEVEEVAPVQQTHGAEGTPAESEAEPAAEPKPVRRGAVPLSDESECTLSAHEFVEKRKSPQAEGN